MSETVIIATHNRSPLLRRTLESISHFTHPSEIIVVDDGGTDDCPEAVGDYESVLPITYVYNNNPGETNCCHARNIALRLAGYEEVISTEPESIFLTDVIAQVRQTREQEPERVLFPVCFHSPHEGATVEESREIRDFPFLNAFRREWLMEIRGWDEGFAGPWGWDDIDLFGRLDYLGHSKWLMPEAKIHHQWHPTRIEPAEENERYARAKVFPRDLKANAGRDWGQVGT